MSSTVSCTDSDKDWFDEFKGDRNQSEAFAEMVQIVKTFEGEVIDEEQLADELKPFFGAAAEVGAYRGTKEALEGQ